MTSGRHFPAPPAAPAAEPARAALDLLWADGLERVEVDAGGIRVRVEVPAGLGAEAREAVLSRWAETESYLVLHPAFAASLAPVPAGPGAPAAVEAMAAAAAATGVAPMVTLPGALVEAICRDLAPLAGRAAVSAEGDTFVARRGRRVHPLHVPRVPGRPPLGLVVGSPVPHAVFCSGGRRTVDPHVGTVHVAVVADHGAMADAAASAAGLTVTRPDLVERGVALARHIDGVRAIALFAGERVGVFGDVEIVPLQR